MLLKWSVTQNVMSLKMKYHSQWNVTQNKYDTWNGMSLKKDCHSKWNGTPKGMSLKTECHSKWYVTQNGMSLKMECHSKCSVTLSPNLPQPQPSYYPIVDFFIYLIINIGKKTMTVSYFCLC